MIHIARDRQVLGKFFPEQVAEGLQSGRFLASDLAWQEPMEAWRPLGEFLDLPAVELPLVPPPLSEESDVPLQPAWERRKDMGILPALFETVRQVLSEPISTFRNMRRQGGLGAPLTFYVLLATPTAWAAMLYQLVAFLINPGALPSMAKALTPSMLIASHAISMALTPFLLVLLAFGASAVFSASIGILGARANSFEAVFRAFCYAVAPASVMRLIPICGDILFFAMALSLLVLAIREAAKTDGLRATIGVGIPSLMCCGLFWFAGKVALDGLSAG